MTQLHLLAAANLMSALALGASIALCIRATRIRNHIRRLHRGR